MQAAIEAYPKAVPEQRGTLTIKPGTPLRALKRKEEPVEIILHESVTRSRKAACKILKKKRCSVHYSNDRDGSVHRHADPRKYYTIHAGRGHNKRSIGIEIINRYYGKYAADGEKVIDAVWAHKGKYILPTRVQMESVWRLIQHLEVEFDEIPIEFPCVARDGTGDNRRQFVFRWGRHKEHTKPGITAHHRHHHADGLFAEHYCFMRSLGYSPDVSFDGTVTEASCGHRNTYMKARHTVHEEEYLVG
jgi:hypothetical protein